MLELIKEQVGSDGRKGWPCAVRDRIAYPTSREDKVTDANVAVTFLWTVRDEILPKLEKKNLALASNFYTPSGLVGMIRNILGNPQVRYIILLGEEYSSRAEEDRISELTSGNALRTFFEKGIDKNRRLPGFENSIHFDENIPTELINKVRKSVEFIDLNKKMLNASLGEKTKEANKLLRTLEKKPPFLEKPATFEYETAAESFPYEGGPLIIHGSTIPATWIEIVHNIYRYGTDNLMNANTDRWIKEINNIVAVVHEPQNAELSLNPFLVPLTQEKIAAYKKEVLSPELPEGKAYTYGNELRAYHCSEALHIKELVDGEEYKDFEFGKGPHLEKNVSYMGERCEIDQIQDIIDALNRDPYSKACVAITWHVEDELMRKHKSSPCLIFLQALVHDEKLNLTVFFRSHDMVQGWPENAYGCAEIQKKIAEGIRVEPGIMTIVSGSAHIYNHYYTQVEEMLKKFRKPKKEPSDPRGNFLIQLKGGRIVVTHTDASGKELESFEGKTALEVRDKIVSQNQFKTDHAIYLGTELQKAEIALNNKLSYDQDMPLKLK